MRTINHIYTDYNNLASFIQDNHVKDSDKLLIQVFSWKIEEKIIKEIQTNLRELLPSSIIIWATTSWEIFEWSSLNENIIISITQLEKSEVKSVLIDFKNKNLEEGIKNISKLIKSNTKAIIAFWDWFSNEVDVFLKEFNKEYSDIIIAWWRAWDNWHFENSYIFDNNTIINKWIVVAILSWDELIARNDYNFWWEAIGKELKITKADKNILYEINSINATKVYEKYLWTNIANELPLNWVEFPIILKKDNTYIARAVLQKLDNWALWLAWEVSEWDIVQFGCGIKEQMINRSYELYNKLIEWPIESTFIYSCAWRKTYLQNDICFDIEFARHLPGACWFFTFAEFFHRSNKYNLLNYTMTILVLSENNSKPNLEKIEPKVHIQDKIIYALSNVIKATNTELLENNEILEKKVQEKVDEIEKSKTDYLEWYRNFIWDMNDIVCMVDKEKNIVYVNNKMIELSWYSKDELIWVSLFWFLDPETQVIAHQHIEEYRNKWLKSSYTWIAINKNHEKIPVKVTGTPFLNWMNIVLIQDLRELEREKMKVRELEELNKLKDNFLNITSHELRTPMTSIRWYMSMMLDWDFGKLDDKLYEILKLMYKNIERLLNLINDMLDLSKLETWNAVFNMTNINLNNLLEEIKKEYSPILNVHWLKLHISCSENFDIKTDENKLKQVVTNLVWNAIKFTPSKWEIKIKVTDLDDDNFKLEVIDNWVGIKKENLEKIFTKFYQVEDSLNRKNQKWTWLWLPISREIAHKLWWDLFVESEEWKGSNFYLVIPKK